MTKQIDFFFSIGSPYAYLGLAPLAAIATQHKAALIPRPTTLITENGGIFAKDRPEPRRRYWLREIDRWAKVRGKVLVMSDRAHLSDPNPAGKMIAAAALDGRDWLRLTDALMQAFWASAKADIGRPEVRTAIADTVGLDGAALLQREADQDVVARWTQNRAEAVRLGVFGFPTCAYEGELYWGQDNLEFLDRHLSETADKG